MDDYLQHHGILGMKWGIRRYQNPDGTLTAAGKKHYHVGPDYDGRIINKNTRIYRITRDADDETYDNKKYVSISKSDHKKWQKYIGDAYKNDYGWTTYNVMYKPVKDLKIAKAEKLWELYASDHMNDYFNYEEARRDTFRAQDLLNYHKDYEDAHHQLSLNLAAQTATGKRYIQRLINMGYDGIEDRHGQNVSKDPMIIFNPDNNLKRRRISYYKKTG